MRTAGRKALSVLVLTLAAAGCGKGFTVWRDYPRAAECYAAYLSLSKYAEDPGLGFTPEQIHDQQLATMNGINRMTPYTLAAAEQAGGDRQFLDLVARWRVKPENDIVRAYSPKAKRDIFDHVVAEAGHCHQTLTRWSAPPQASAKP